MNYKINFPVLFDYYASCTVCKLRANFLQMEQEIKCMP